MMTESRDWHPMMDGMCGHPDPRAASAGFFIRGGGMITTVQVSSRIIAQGPLVWRRGDRAAVDTGGGRTVEGRIIEPRRRDWG